MMKVMCPVKGLSDALNAIHPVVPLRAVNETLTFCKMSAVSDGLFVTAFDGEVGVRYRLLGVTVERPGEALLPAAILTQIVRMASGDWLTVESKAGDSVLVGCDGSRFELPYRSVDSYPEWKQPETTNCRWESSAVAISQSMSWSSFARSKEDTGRFATIGLFWQAENGVLKMVATDTRRLAVSSCPVVIHGSHPGLILPPKAVSAIERACDSGGEVVILPTDNGLLARFERCEVYAQQLSGRFPPYQEVLGRLSNCRPIDFFVAAESLLSAVRQAVVTVDKVDRRMELSFEGNRLMLSCNSDSYGRSRVTIPVDGGDASSHVLELDPQYLLDFLRVVGSGSLNLCYYASDKPLLVKYGENVLYLLMPLCK